MLRGLKQRSARKGMPPVLYNPITINNCLQNEVNATSDLGGQTATRTAASQNQTQLQPKHKTTTQKKTKKKKTGQVVTLRGPVREFYDGGK